MVAYTRMAVRRGRAAEYGLPAFFLRYRSWLEKFHRRLPAVEVMCAGVYNGPARSGGWKVQVLYHLHPLCASHLLQASVWRR